MRNPRPAGFTLLELMIVVAVIAILAMIAIPSYLEQVRKGKRAEALQAIGDLQLRQERWRAEHATYGALADLGGASLNSSLKNYTISLNDPPIAGGYTITATRKNDLANDPKCANFTMTVASGAATKGMSDGQNVDYCWRQ